MARPQARETGCVWTASGQCLQVVAEGGTVTVAGVALGHADREAFVRAFFLASADADAWAMEHGGDGDE